MEKSEIKCLSRFAILVLMMTREKSKKKREDSKCMKTL